MLGNRYCEVYDMANTLEYISKILDQIQDDPILHLSLHLSFVCSLRAGEIVAIDIHSINLDEGSMWISQILERVSDEALKISPEKRLLKFFRNSFQTLKATLSKFQKQKAV